MNEDQAEFETEEGGLLSFFIILHATKLLVRTSKPMKALSCSERKIALLWNSYTGTYRSGS